MPDDIIDLTRTDRPLRLERDALGPRAVPAEALYGIHTMRALDTITISSHRLRDYPVLVSAFGAVKQAAARANGDAGALDQVTSRAIDAAAGRFTAADDSIRAHLVADLLAGGGSISVHMNVNEVLANVANLTLGHPLGSYDPVTPKEHAGASQSTADVCHTASRLAALHAGEHLAVTVTQLIAAMQAKAREFAGTVTLARTCLQDGMPVSAGLLLDGAATALGRRSTALGRALEPLAGVTLGGTVIGTGDGSPLRYRERVVPHLCAITERSLYLHPDRASALQHSDDLVALIGEVASIAAIAGKTADDLRLLGSGPIGGLGELELPHVLEGSSFFTDKRNPVVAESVINAAVQVTGHEVAARAAAGRAELHLQVFDNVVVVNTLDAIAIVDAALRGFTAHCVDGLRIDAARCADLVDRAVAQPSLDQ